MTLRQRSGFFVLIILIIIAQVILHFYSFEKEIQPISPFSSEELAMIEAINFKSNDKDERIKEKEIQYFNFNPNTLDEEGFTRLGFSTRQANSIIKYRYIKGGNFSTIQEFGASYVISDEKLEKLRPYIHLSDIQQSNKSNGNHHFKNKKEGARKIKPFNLNKTSLAGFISLGFSKKQAQTILNFKNSLTNKSFESKEQFHKCYAVNDYMYNKLQSYIRIKKTDENIEDNNRSEKYNINTINESKFVDLGFSKEEASNIIKYRAYVGGINDTLALKKCKYVREEIYQNIKNQVIF
ncbi:MAG: ComEA family DNA-binding protein [Weeksellaceae bacterium]